MSWTVECAQCCAFGLELLAIAYGEPVIIWLVLVNFRVRRVRKEVWDAFDVVVVPVRQEDFVDGDVLLAQDGLEGRYPLRFALAGINEDS
jgi:hypothetical protein